MDHLRALRVLGLAPGSTAEDIRSAWRDLAKVWHPDRFPHDDRLRAKAGANLQRINEAHEALKDYDPGRAPTVAARMRESVAIVFGIGDLGPAPPVTGEQRLTPSAPVGEQTSAHVLALGGLHRYSTAARTAQARSRRMRLMVGGLVVLVVAAVGVLLYLRSAR